MDRSKNYRTEREKNEMIHVEMVNITEIKILNNNSNFLLYFILLLDAHIINEKRNGRKKKSLRCNEKIFFPTSFLQSSWNLMLWIYFCFFSPLPLLLLHQENEDKNGRWEGREGVKEVSMGEEKEEERKLLRIMKIVCVNKRKL